MPGRSLFLVFTQPVEGQEEQYNEWYDVIHLADVVKIPGVSSAQRYEIAEPKSGEGRPVHRHLAIYEIDGDPDRVLDEMTTRFGTDRMRASPALDVPATAMAVWTARGPRIVAEP